MKVVWTVYLFLLFISPLITKAVEYFTVFEEQQAGTFVGNITRRDNFKYYFRGQVDYFQINPDYGSIFTKTKIDLETIGIGELRYIVLSSTPIYATEVSIRVLDVNDNTPKFKSSVVDLQILESVEIGSLIPLDSASDPDEGSNSALTYTILNGNEDGKFEVEVILNLLHLKLKKKLDREIEDKYYLNISAVDNGSPRRAGYVGINITIGDINDNTPLFNPTSYKAEIFENATVGTNLLQLRATDQDTGTNGQVTYSLQDVSVFLINKNTGIISLKGELDFETLDSYTLIVVATDGGNPAFSARATVTVAVKNVNDNRPIISSHVKSNLTLTEGVTHNYFLFLTISDKDFGPVTLQIISGNSGGKFRIISFPPSGSFLSTTGPLDREKQSQFSLLIRATDSGNPALSSDELVLIDVGDENDNKPVFEQKYYEARVKEGCPFGSYVGYVKATDIDAGLNSAVRYSITNGNFKDWFKISHLTGLIVTNTDSIDFDILNSSFILLNIAAIDMGTPPLNTYTTFNITIENLNDNAPMFNQSLFAISVSESLPADSVILKLEAKDSDLGMDGTIFYEFHFPSLLVMEHFQMNGLTGEISLTKKVDFRENSLFSFYVLAKDRGTPSRHAKAQVMIRIIDTDNHSPAFAVNNFYVNILASKSHGHIETFHAVDHDSGKFGEIIYTIETSSCCDFFVINSSTGALNSTKSLIIGTVYDVYIKATSNGKMAKASVKINVLANLLNNPIFERDYYSFNVNENLIGNYVGKVVALHSKPDQIMYSIIAGDGYGNFKVNEIGEIFTNKPIDREKNSKFKLIIAAWTNQTSFLTAKTQATIMINDLNDNKPALLRQDVAGYYVREDSRIGYTIFRVDAVDFDSGMNGLVRYSILQPSIEALFKIDQSTGNVYLGASLMNKNNSKKFSLDVEVSDMATARQSLVLNFVINLIDTNNHSPIFSANNYDVVIPRNLTVNSRFLKIKASDNDFGANSKIMYRIVNGNVENTFGIFPSGWIYLKALSLVPSMNFYLLNVTASDQGSPPRFSSTKVTIAVQQSGGISTIFKASIFYSHVLENRQPDTSVAHIRDNLISKNGITSFKFGISTALFTIGQKDGVVKTKGSLDREEIILHYGNGNITLVVIVNQFSNRKLVEESCVLVINIQDENDNGPVFEKPIYSAAVIESASPGTSILKVWAVDKDSFENSSKTYEMLPVTPVFILDPSSGIISLASVSSSLRLDYERKRMYNFSVIARDSKNASMFVTCQVFIYVTDSNDNRPTFNGAKTTLQVNEGMSVGKTVFTFNATDKDSGMNGFVEYSLTSSSDAGIFAINRFTGEMYLLKALDYEAKQSHVVEVTASDGGSPTLKESITVKISVTDANDNYPKFSEEPRTIYVEENIALQSVISRCSANDLDSGSNKVIRYTVAQQGPVKNVFKVDPNNCYISIQAPIDREKHDTFYLVIQAENNASKSMERLSVTKNFTIIIEDVNDNRPTFIPPLGAGISRTSATGWEAITVTAEDPDNSVNGTVRYSINKKLDHACFSINPRTGKVTVTAPLSSSKKVFEIEVQGNDQSLHNSKSSIALIRLFVFGAPANAPSCSRGQVNLSENVNVGTDVFRMSAISSQSNSQMLYVMKSGNTNNVFYVNSTTGWISTRKEIDFDLGPKIYDLVVYAVEKSGSVPMTVECQVRIDIQDVNDNSPFFVDAASEIAVLENATVGSEVYKFNARDKDSDKYGAIRYTLISGNSFSIFSLDSRTGRLVLAKKLNEEKTTLYNLTIGASDAGSKMSVTQLKVKVTDVNDHSPTFAKQYYSFTIREGSPTDTFIGQVNAVDKDVGRNGQVYYEILNQNQYSFAIDHMSGKIWLTGSVDYEFVSNFILDVKATDYGFPKLSSTIVVFVNLMDVNDNCPKFLVHDYFSSIEENLPANTFVIKVSATDKDTGVNGIVKYDIVDGDVGNAFIIDGNGEIRTKIELDREKKATYDLLIQASDRGSRNERTCLSYAKAVVNVLDVNDNTPVLNKPHVIRILENIVVGSIVHTFSGIDRDFGANSSLKYSLIEPNEVGDIFELAENGNLVLLSQLDFETKKELKIEIRVSDSGNPAKMSFSPIKISILDVNDNSPVIKQHPSSISVLENITVGTTLIELTSVDLDSGENARVTYSILSGNSNDTFNIEAQSGILYLEKELDREIKDQYTLVIEVKDHGLPQRRGITTLSIVLTDVNDNAPYFPLPFYNVSARENVIVSDLLKLQATDRDIGTNGEVRYRLETSSVSKMFSIGAESGIISLVKELDREVLKVAKLVIIAMDNGTPSLSKSTTVFVNILDDNDNFPSVKPGNATKYIKENGNANAEVQMFWISDPDNGENATVEVNLVKNFASFQIKQTNNQYTIYTTRGLNREVKDYYVLEIEASDKGSPRKKTVGYVHLFVEDDNDSPPVFTKKRYEFKAQANSQVGSLIAQLHASDRDTVSNSNMLFTMIAGNTTYVGIEADTGVIFTRMKIPLNTEFEIRVEVSDPSKAAFKDTATVVIVTATGYPRFAHGSLYGSLSESSNIGTLVKKVTATSEELGPAGKISYYIQSGNIGLAFRINQTNGEVTVGSALDYESKNIYSLWIEARDSKNPPLSAFVKFVITVKNENDSVPVITSPKAAVMFTENQGSNALVTRVVAVDRDNPSLTSRLRFGLGRNAASVPFTIDTLNGEVRSTEALDREKKDKYTIAIVAYPVGQRWLSYAANLTVEIQDLNDNQPTIHSPSQVNVSENMALNSEVMVLNVTDNDAGANGQVTFHLISDTFSIESNSGRLVLIKTLDREVQSSYTLAISVRDPNYRKIFVLTVLVTDINDSPPIFLPSNIYVNVSESTPVGQVFGQVKADDKDLGMNSMSFYHIEPRSGHGYIAIDSLTGSLSLKRNVKFVKILPGQEKNNNLFQFAVKARNLYSPFFVGNGTLHVRIVDANNHAPVFSKVQYQAYLESTTSVNHLVIEVSAEDKLDVGLNADVKYSIVGGNGSGLFMLDGTRVRVKSVLSSYVNSVLTVVIQAKDLGAPSKSSTATLYVMVTEQNRYSPSFSKSNYEVSIPEIKQLRREVLRVSALDQDSGENGVVSYHIVSGNTDARFHVGKENGSLFLVKPLDYEEASSYNLAIQAKDNGKVHARTSNTRVRVLVTDVNDNVPRFTSATYAATVTENAPVNTQIMKVQAIDKDSSAANTITYEISDPTGRLYFTIDSGSGIIRTRTGIDYERNSFFNIKISATDNGSPRLSSVVDVKIKVVGVNEFSPKFTRKSYFFSVSRYAAINSIIGTVSASDNDNGIDGVSVFLPRFMQQNNFFSLHKSSGNLTVRKTLSIGNYTLPIFVKNLVKTVLSPSDIDEARIYVTVVAGNEPPAFSAASYSASVLENSVTGKSVLSVSATDSDAKAGGTIRYQIAKQSPFDAFVIDYDTGLLTVNAALDRERETNFYITVRAVDNGVPPASNTTSVAISILDANDNKPRIISCTGKVLENATTGTIVTKLNVFDGDKDPNRGPFLYNVIGTQAFRVNAKDQLTVNAALDREKMPIYNLTIDVTDNGSPSQRSRNYCIVTILDVSDVKPRVRNVSVILNTLGTFPTGGLIGDLSPTDPDSSDKYVCSTSQENALFRFEKLSCRLNVASHRTVKNRKVTFTAVTHDSNITDVANIYFILIVNATASNTMVLRMHGIEETVQDFTNKTISSLNRALESISPVSSIIRVVGYKKQSATTLDILIAQQDKTSFEVKLVMNLQRVISTNIGLIQQVTGSSHVDIPFKACVSPNQCSNNGTCYEVREIENYPTIWSSESLIFHSVSFKATFACSCRPGFYGRRCEKIILSCSPNPCQNGGVCTQSSESGKVVRRCTCVTGFSGKFCEEDVNECALSPCKNGGVCLNAKGSYSCRCGLKYTGKNCENVVDFCAPNPCLFGGKCIPNDVSFKCSCKFGNQGKFCEINPMTFPALSYLSADQATRPHQSLNITLEFATHDKQSLLMYGFHSALVGALSPFVGLELINGKVQFSYNFGSSMQKLSTDALVINDGNWHSASIFLSSQKLILKVDNTVKQRSLNEASQSPDLGGAPIYIGGVPSIDAILKRPKQMSIDDYTGCMRNIYINGYHLDQSTALKSHYVTSGCTKAAGCASNSCKNGDCKGSWDSFQCQCKSGFSGDSCDQAAKPFTFGGTSFVVFKLKDSYRRKMQLAMTASPSRRRRAVVDFPTSNSLNIEFRTRKEHGVLLFALDVGGNFTVLHIQNGKIHYKFDLKGRGSGALVITRPLITDGKWHNISLVVSDKTVSLSLDDNQVVQNSFSISPHKFYSTYTDALSIAGTQIPRYLDGVLLPTFNGCLNRIALNDANLAASSSDKFNVTRVGPVTNSCAGRNVCLPNPCTDPTKSYCVDEWEAYKCVDPGQCKNAPCKHNGICIPTVNSYTCNCHANFTGKNCETPVLCLGSPCRSEESCVPHETKIFECVPKPQVSKGSGLGSTEIALIVVFTIVGIVLILFIAYCFKKRRPIKQQKEFTGNFNDTGNGIEMRHTKGNNFDNRGFESEPYLEVVQGSQQQLLESKRVAANARTRDSVKGDGSLISRSAVEFISTSQPAFMQPRSRVEVENVKGGSNRSLPLMKYQDDFRLEKQRNERILQELRGPDLLSSQYTGRDVPILNEANLQESLRRSDERLKEIQGSSKLGTATPPFESGFESTGSDIDSEPDHASELDIVDGSSQLELYDLEVASIGFSEMSWQNDNNSSSSRDIRRDYIDKRLDRLRHLVPQFNVYDHGSTLSDRNTRSDRLSDRLSDLVEQDSSSDSDGSFTGSEYEYGDERISTNKLNRKHLVFSKHPQTSDSDAESSFMPRRRNSLESSITSMTDVGSIRHPHAPEHGIAQDIAIPPIDWDELLNWAMKYENLADVYREIALLDDRETDDDIVLKPERISSARASVRQLRDNELLQKPVKFYSAQELHSEEYV